MRDNKTPISNSHELKNSNRLKKMYNIFLKNYVNKHLLTFIFMFHSNVYYYYLGV